MNINDFLWLIMDPEPTSRDVFNLDPGQNPGNAADRIRTSNIVKSQIQIIPNVRIRIGIVLRSSI